MLHDFQYLAPASMEELLRLLAEHGDNARVMAGGTDLLVNIRAGLSKPAYVIDLKGVAELRRLSVDKKEGVSIGACVTVNELVDNADVAAHYQVLKRAGEELATYQLRNRATVVGNIVTASPCGDMTSPLLCLDAAVNIRSQRGSRSVPLSQFITGVKQTVLAPDELVESISCPAETSDARGAYYKLKRIVGHDLGLVAVAATRRNGSMRVAISSAAPTPILLPELAADRPVEEIQQLAAAEIKPIDDVRCSKEYRAFMVGEYVERAVKEVTQ